jgi:hypothetical protein
MERVLVISLAKECIKLIGLKSFALSAMSAFGISEIFAQFNNSSGPVR